MPRVKVTRNYQVTIPTEIRSRIGLKEGDYLEVELDEKGRIVMTKIKRERKTLRSGRKLRPHEIESLIIKGLSEALV